jgi:hypothetical protein
MEIAVEGEDITGIELLGEVDEAGVSQIHRNARVLFEQTTNRRRLVCKVEWYVENPPLHIFQDRVDGSRETAEKIAGFGDHGIAGHER